MFNIALISFRETFEMLLIIVPLIAYITRLGRRDLSKYIYIGSFSGLIASILSAIVLFAGIKGLEGFSQNIFEGSMSFFLCGLIIYSIVWLGAKKNNYSSEIENKFKVQTTGISLFLLSSLTIFRECLELILFTLPFALVNTMNIISGVFIGLSATTVLGFIVYKTSIKLNITVVFSFITLFLIYIGSVMFGEGLEKFFPQYGNGIITAGEMIFGIPMLFIFLKSEIKKYTKKQP